MLRYLGPDTAMPLASAVAAIAGVVIMFWQRTVAGARSIARFIGERLARLTRRP